MNLKEIIIKKSKLKNIKQIYCSKWDLKQGGGIIWECVSKDSDMAYFFGYGQKWKTFWH